MYSKDYSTLNNTANATKNGASSLGPNKCSAASGSGNNTASNANASQTLNKSLESVIRKAAYKGIEPLRRRYTAAMTQSSSGSGTAH